ncbi:hypothetical protein ES707_21740 [subsurface metagenome]
MMEKGSSWCFYHPNALFWSFSRQIYYIGGSKLRVMSELQHSFRGIKRLNKPSPVESQSTVNRLPAQHFIHFLVGFLSQRRRHPIRYIQTSQRGYSINTAILPVNKPFPAYILKIAELNIRPWLDMLPDVVKVFLRSELGELLTIRVNHPNHAIIEVDLVILIHQPHIISPVLVDVPDNKVNIIFVFQHYIIKKGEDKFTEVYRIFPGLYDGLSFILGNCF